MKRARRILAAVLSAALLFTMEGMTVPASQQMQGEAMAAGEATEVIPVGEEQLSYLVFGSSYLETPASQYVLVGIGDGTYSLDTAVLHYRNRTTGKDFTVEADTLDGDAALFYMDFPDTSYTGSYEVISIDYVAEGVAGSIVIADTGMEAGFGVNQAVDAKPDAVAIDEQMQEDIASTVITDAEGNLLSEYDLQEAISNANRTVSSDGDVASTGAGTLVIVLDPGHGGTDVGAARTINGVTYYERDIVLKIAKYCKEELETYSGVKVYLTRTNNTSALESRQQRVEKAHKWNADILISFHINSTGNEVDTANGAAVYIPNKNYNVGYDYNGVGKALANKILAQLKKLGLANNGTKLSEGGTYPDGSTADSLGINYYSKQLGYKFAGILIEHAFINNPDEVAHYLSSNKKLKEIGIADATGIAKYYGLKKSDASAELGAPLISYITSASSTSLNVSWTKVEEAAGYQLYRSESEEGDFEKIATVTDKELYTDKDLEPGKTYYYKVQAYTEDETSEYSAAMSAFPLVKGEITSVKSNGGKTLTIKWSAAEGAQKYQLYRSTEKNGTYTKIAEVDAKTKTYTDTGLKNGTTYYYKLCVKASQNGEVGYGSFSDVVSGWSIVKTKITAVKSQSSGKLLIEWKAIKNAYRYQVYRSTSKKGEYTKIATVKGTSYEDETAKANKQYYYKIRTVNRVNKVNGYGNYSAVMSGMQVGKTTISTIKTASSTSLKITWKKAKNATGYNLYRSTSKKGTYKLIKTITNGNTTSYTNKKLKEAKTYYYKIQVVGGTGNSEGVGKMSGAVSGSTVLKTDITYVQSVGSKKLKIAWNKVSGATGYRIARSTSEEGTYTVIANIASGETATYTDTTVKAGKKYYYKVSVQNKNGEVVGYSGYSAVVSGKTVKPTTVEAPKSVSVSAIELNWTYVSGASGYQIYRSTAEKSGYTKIATISSGKTVTYQDTPPETNVTYYYKIRSTNKNNGKVGYSGFSAPAAGKSLAVPKLNTIKQASDGALQISWKKVGGATKYYVYRKDGSDGKYKKIAEVKSSENSYQDKDVKSGITYYYKVMAYNKVNGVTGNSGYSAVKSYKIELYEIMGEAGVTEEQMVDYYNALIALGNTVYSGQGKGYPSDVYKDKGAEDIETFVSILYEEATAEGVKPEVVFIQMCNETNLLRFGGDVKVEQCNFAGIGATGGGVQGNTFKDVRTGLRAQVQHLKAYACEDDLEQKCVDPRFQYVKRGTCKYVEWLGIQENPNTVWNKDGTIASGCGWATAKNYGYTLRSAIDRLKKY